jgi:hypothetical protein
VFGLGRTLLSRLSGDIDQQALPFASLIENSGHPERFTLKCKENGRVLVVGDKLSRVAFSIPTSAPEKLLQVTPTMLRCGYVAGVAENWMVIERKSELGAMTQERALAAHILLLQQRRPGVDILSRAEAPARLNDLDKIFPHARRVVRAWVKDRREDDYFAAVALADLRDYRLFQTVEGTAAAVLALAQLSFATALHPDLK